MDANGSSSRSWLDDIAARAEQELAALQSKRDALMQEINVLDAEMRAIRNVARSASPTYEKRKYTRSPLSKRPSSVSRSTVAQIAQSILDLHANDTFTALQLHEEMGAGWSEPHTYTALNQLRNMQFIGKAGMVPGKGHAKRQTFRVLDRDIASQLVNG